MGNSRLLKDIRQSFGASKSELLAQVAVRALAAGALWILAHNTVSAREAPVADPALQARLKVRREFTIRPGETLESAAQLFYGHRTWWKIVQKANPQFSNYGPQDRLPRGTRLVYRAPEVKTDYVVQPGDWLIRIALWKFGDTTQWERLFQKNADKISNPNLIRPGDRLTLKDDGTVLNARSGKVLMDGVVPSSLPDQMAERARMLASDVQKTELWQQTLSNPTFFAGFCVGVLLLLFTPMTWLVRRFQQLRLSSESDAIYLGELEAEWREEEGLNQPPFTFKKRPVERLQVDRSLLSEATGEADRRPGYHSLFRKVFRKYRKSWVKTR